MTETTLQTGSALIASWSKGTRTPEPGRLDVLIDVADLLPAVKALLDAHWGHLGTITALDYLGKSATLAQEERYRQLIEKAHAPADADVLEVLYFFASGPAMLTLRALVLRNAAVVPSVCGLIPGASFYEREMSEMFGIGVTDTPDPRRLFLPDIWPENLPPLRKDFIPNKG
jgi:NADH:ubiquinone oxidoreductase subunit C